MLLVERDHHAELCTAEITPVRAADNHAATVVALVVHVRLEEIETDDAGPARLALPPFSEERHAAALHVSGDERIVRRLQILRGEHDVRALVSTHANRHVARTIFRVPAVLVEAGDAHLPELAVFRERTEGRAAIDALVLVDLSAATAFAVVHT